MFASAAVCQLDFVYLNSPTFSRNSGRRWGRGGWAWRQTQWEDLPTRSRLRMCAAVVVTATEKGEAKLVLVSLLSWGWVKIVLRSLKLLLSECDKG